MTDHRSNVERRHRRLQADRIDSRGDGLVPSEDLGFAHSVLCQCFLPYRRLADDAEPYEVFRYDRAGRLFCGIALESGWVWDAWGKRVRPGIPYGPKARVFLSWVTTEAMRRQSPELEVPRSMTALMRDLGMGVSGGKTGTIRPFQEQLQRLSATRLSVLTTREEANGHRLRQATSPIVRSFDVWFPRDPRQETLWPSHLVLSPDFYENLMAHAVPYDRSAMWALSHSARAMDAYLWLTQRLPRVPAGKAPVVAWDDLQAMFGGGDKHRGSFQREFRRALTQALDHYPEARVTEVDAGLQLRPSPPPVQRLDRR